MFGFRKFQFILFINCLILLPIIYLLRNYKSESNFPQDTTTHVTQQHKLYRCKIPPHPLTSTIKISETISSYSCSIDYNDKIKIIANHSTFNSTSQQLTILCPLNASLDIVLSPDYITHRSTGSQTSVSLLINRLPDKQIVNKRQKLLNEQLLLLRKTDKIQLSIVDDELFTVTCNNQEQLFIQTIFKPEVANRSIQKQNRTKRNLPPVLVIEFDGVSRTHFHRKMINTMDYLQHKLSVMNYTIVDFEKYHALDRNSDGNIRSMFCASGKYGWGKSNNKDKKANLPCGVDDFIFN
ncbi:unnamed protein product, partial [Didymodactylos carnosus]